MAVSCAFGREARHVGGLAEAEAAAGLGGLQRRRAVGVLGEHVHALVEQRLGGVGLLRRVNQELAQTTLIFTFGFTDCAPRKKALMPDDTSGIGKAPT